MTGHLACHARDPDAGRVLRFWFGEGANYSTRRAEWFRKDPQFDARVASNFLSLYEKAAAGSLLEWEESPADALARILVLDQFPRNMFRGTARAFATDALALGAAQHALRLGHDRSLLPSEKLFLILPFEHAESLEMQERSCELARPLARFPETHDVYRYALAHREIIARFGRFPHRNALLGRACTPEELEFLQQPGSSF